MNAYFYFTPPFSLLLFLHYFLFPALEETLAACTREAAVSASEKCELEEKLLMLAGPALNAAEPTARPSPTRYEEC